MVLLTVLIDLIKCIKMDIKFSKLWVNHPAVKGDFNPCTSEDVVNYKNQSAIRMGICLMEAGISLGNFIGEKCLPEHNHDQSHILHPEELANWLESEKALFGVPTKNKRVRSSQYKRKKGIVLLKNYWSNGCLCNHIDLWNGNIMTYGAAVYFTSSKEIWFWEMKNA